MATILRARYVFPVTSDPIPDGFICLERDRIVACGAGVPPAPQSLRDLGNVAILPGLVNAHVHLDFGDLPAPLGHRGIRFADWLRCVMEFRRAASPDRPATTPGLDESLRAGVTALGDIVQPRQPMHASPLDVTAFLELVAPTAARVAGAMEPVDSHLQAAHELGIQAGLSPHAPYSVHPQLLAAVVELSRRHRLPIAMHLAESPEELELLQHGTGPLQTFLEELGAWDPTAFARGMRPLDLLSLLASAHRTLVIHGNYLDDEEVAFLSAHAERMSVVYCPRSHDWFARPVGRTFLSAAEPVSGAADKNVCPTVPTEAVYPLEKLLSAGATVALGTDGRGSSPDASLLAEMQFAATRHPSVPLAGVLRMGTINGARALGHETEFGSLDAGKRADLAVVALPDREAADPHELLFDPAATVVACYCRGESVVPDRA